MKYSGTWGLSTSAVYVGGKARVGSVAGRSATLAFNGNRLAWLSRTGPTYGSARVYIDGSLVKTVNLNAATVTDRKMVFVRSWSAVGNHDPDRGGRNVRSPGRRARPDLRPSLTRLSHPPRG